MLDPPECVGERLPLVDLVVSDHELRSIGDGQILNDDPFAPGYGAFPKSKSVLRLLLVRCLRRFGLVQTARVLILDRPDLALTDLHVMASRAAGCLSRRRGQPALAGLAVDG